MGRGGTDAPVDQLPVGTEGPGARQLGDRPDPPAAARGEVAGGKAGGSRGGGPGGARGAARGGVRPALLADQFAEAAFVADQVVCAHETGLPDGTWPEWRDVAGPLPYQRPLSPLP